MKVIIINGPNLNLLGTREPSVYGNESFDIFFAKLQKSFPRIELIYYQSNVEGLLIDKIHEYGFSVDAILLNAGGYTHTSIALSDAIAAVSSPCIEIHISQPAAREEFRHKSMISGVCSASISGFGLDSYRLALNSLMKEY
ncbi:MAG: 3-dehydroquinate dehydratase [Flavobacteriales bacterium]|nr:3-dehydroquinate dehydratase [Flavobacteriales bacterium]|tara:strand:+ start:1308 stop:1730 length:423 start_codon:yes stop_codon:yes gene_type:complete